MTVATDAGTLTTRDARNLREADSISFHRLAGGSSFLTVTFRDYDPAGNRSYERDYTIPADSKLVNFNKKSGHGDNWIGFFMISGAKFDSAWKTIAKTLRKGDRLTMEWVRENNSKNLDDAGMAADEIYLHVLRGNSARKFMVGYLVAPKDSPARIVTYR